MSNALFVDSRGFIIPRPYRDEFASDYEYALAFHEYRRRIDAEASRTVYHKVAAERYTTNGATQMTKNLPDFVQAPATGYTGSAPVAGVIYEWHSGGVPSQYCVATGERQKNGKYVMRMHDVFCGPRKKVVKVGMDEAWFRQWKRCQTVPGYVHALLTAK